MRFADFGSRTVLAAFDGGEITSDAGIILLRERAKQIGLFDHIAACFTDRRNPKRVKHHLPSVFVALRLAMRILMIMTPCAMTWR